MTENTTTTENLQSEVAMSEEIKNQITHNPSDNPRAVALAKQINLNDPQALINYGADIDASKSEFEKRITSETVNKDAGELGDTLKNLTMVVRKSSDKKYFVDPNQKDNFLSKIFQKAKKSAFEIRLGLQDLDTQLNNLTGDMNTQIAEAEQSIHEYEDMYNQTLELSKTYSDSIDALQIKINELNNDLIPKLTQKVNELQKTNPQSADALQASNELQNYHEIQRRAERRLLDLQSSRMLAIQKGPQVRMLQRQQQDLIEQTHTLIATGIPTLRSQMALQIAAMRSKAIADSNAEIRAMTNQQIINASKVIGQVSIQTAEQAEQAVIDMDTIQKAQDTIINSIDKIKEIQVNGSKERQLQSAKMAKMEKDLYNRLHKSSMKDVTPEQLRIQQMTNFSTDTETNQ